MVACCGGPAPLYSANIRVPNPPYAATYQRLRLGSHVQAELQIAEVKSEEVGWNIRFSCDRLTI